MNAGHFIGIALALGALVWVEISSIKKIKTAEDFDKGGGRSGIWLVSGALLGSLIGGQSTIGTAQLAYTYGLAAIWFTLGAAIGCFILYIGYVIPLRKNRDTTLLEVIGKQFGRKAEYLGSVLCSFGILVSVVSNIIASSALVMAIGGCTLTVGVLISITIMAIYVAFSGEIGAGMGGIVKVILLFAVSAICIASTVYMAGEFGPGTAIDFKLKDLFARGIEKELCNCLSLILGVLSTQTYAQAIWSAKNYHIARKAALLSGMMCIPVGVGGVLVGLYMRAHEVVDPVEAFPMFLLEHLPPVIGGLGIGALFITVVTGGGGLVLGVSTIFVRDILGRVSEEYLSGKKHLDAMRITIVTVLIVTGITAILLPGAIINDLGFLSMGLRGTVIFIPLTLALFFKGRFKGEGVIVSMIVGPTVLILANILNTTIEPLILGVCACIISCVIGIRRKRI